jgi:2-haloacid dehalogenase
LTPPARSGVVFFDLFGTLLDLSALVPPCELAAPGRGADLATRWRRQQLEISWLRTAMASYVDFDQVTSDALDAADDELGLELGPDARADLARAFEHLPVAAGATATLEGLAGHRIPTGVLTNASRPTLGRVLPRTGLERLLDHALSVDAVERYKPDPAVYRLTAEATGVEPERIGFVTANGWDAAGASAFGLNVAWLRTDVPMRLPRVGVPAPAIATWDSVVDLFG